MELMKHNSIFLNNQVTMIYLVGSETLSEKWKFGS